MRLLEKYATQTLEELHEWAEELAEADDGLEVLELDPEKYPHQQMLTHTLRSEPLPPEEIPRIATKIDDRFTDIDRSVGENDKALRNIENILDSGQNVFYATDHNEFKDIAFLMASVATRLRDQDCEFDSSIIVNKLIPLLGVEIDGIIIPASEALGFAFNELYLTLPRTKSTDDKLTIITDGAIKAYNRQVVEHGIERRLKASRRLGTRAMLVGGALPGTRNKRLDVDRYRTEAPEVEIPEEFIENTVVIGKVNPAVLKFTRRALTFLSSAQLARDNIKVHIFDEPQSIRTEEKLTDAMVYLADVQSANDPQHHYVYDRHGVLPVTR